jgi:hypothetical protein
MHFELTANPTAAWVVQQLREAFPEASAPAYSRARPRRDLREDCSGGPSPFWHRASLDRPSKPRQNGIAERWVGTCRRELLDQVIVLNERHLPRRLGEYVVAYYNAERVHTRLRDAPHGRPLEPRPSPGLSGFPVWAVFIIATPGAKRRRDRSSAAPRPDIKARSSSENRQHRITLFARCHNEKLIDGKGVISYGMGVALLTAQ